MMQRMYSILFAMLTAGLLPGCGALVNGVSVDPSSDAWAKKEVAPDAWAVEPAPLPAPPEERSARAHEAGASVVYLNIDRTVTFSFASVPGRFSHQAHLINPRTHVDVSRSLLILTQAGVQSAKIEVLLPPGSVLSAFEAVTHTPDGRQIRLDSPRFVTLAEHEGKASARKMVFAFPHAEPGAVVSWRYRISQRGYKPFDTWRLPNHTPVRNARYHIRSYEFLSLGTQRTGVIADPKTKTGRQVELSWRASDLPYVPYEARQSRSAGRAEVVYVLQDVEERDLYSSWNNVFEGYQERAGSMFSGLPSRWREIPRPTGSKPAAALRLVQDELALGTTPLPESDDTLLALHRYRRATPMEHTLATYMLLRYWDAPCDLVYTTPAGSDPIVRHFARPHRAGQLLLSCEKILLDPTCIGCAPGTISPALRGRPAVRLVRDVIDFIVLPDVPDPVVQRRLTVSPEARGLVAKSGRVVLRGMNADRARAWFSANPLPPKARSEAARRRFLDDIEATSISVRGLDKPDGPVQFELSNMVVSRNGWTRSDGWITTAFDVVFGEGVFKLLHQPDRTAPIRLSAQDGFDNQVDLQTPAGWATAQMLEPLTLESPYGRYVFAVEKTATGHRLSETLDVNAQIVDPARWPALRDFLTAVRAHRQQLITWRKEA